MSSHLKLAPKERKSSPPQRRIFIISDTANRSKVAALTKAIPGIFECSTVYRQITDSNPLSGFATGDFGLVFLDDVRTITETTKNLLRTVAAYQYRSVHVILPGNAQRSDPAVAHIVSTHKKDLRTSERLWQGWSAFHLNIRRLIAA